MQIGLWSGLVLIIVAAIVFVKAGGSGAPGTSGGDQSAKILAAAGSAGANLIDALEGSAKA